MSGAGVNAVLLAIVALALGCRTPPGAEPSPALPDAAIAGAGSVSCGPARSCTIADGEHCCDSSPLECRTTPCDNANQFDCDGPEDCGGSPCCFPIRNALSRASCASTCANGSVLCHSSQDCPATTVCCLNFVLAPTSGLCLAACD